jgi:peptide/nickel transport system permease protein
MERWYTASQGQLIWWRFQKHKLAVVAMTVLAIIYFVAFFSEFFVPYGVETRFAGYENAPPSKIHIYAEGEGLQRPFIYKTKRQMNRKTFRLEYSEDTSQKFIIRFFAPGEEYKLLTLIPMRRHLFTVDGTPFYLMGADRLGRDLYSRTIQGARISLLIGLGGVFLSFVLGCTLGGLSGFAGGAVDEVIQRIIDVLLSIPTIPLWMALAAAIPRQWTVTQTYFAIVMVLAVVGWAGLARVVRGKVLSLREEDYVLAAKVFGSTQTYVIIRHMLPNFLSYLIVHITLAIPGTILGETALSFLGLGMQPPAVSWGVLLREAQDVAAIAHRPWQLIPGAFVVITVLMFNFMGDGLRDAADPYR